MGAVADNAALGNEPPDEVARGAAGELAKLAVEMRLVRIAGGVGNVAPARRHVLDLLADVLEAQQSPDGLGRQSHLALKAIAQVAPAAAQLGGQRLHADRTVAGAQALPRPRHRRVGFRGGRDPVQAAQQETFDQMIAPSRSIISVSCGRGGSSHDANEARECS